MIRSLLSRMHTFCSSLRSPSKSIGSKKQQRVRIGQRALDHVREGVGTPRYSQNRATATNKAKAIETWCVRRRRRWRARRVSRPSDEGQRRRANIPPMFQIERLVKQIGQSSAAERSETSWNERTQKSRTERCLTPCARFGTSFLCAEDIQTGSSLLTSRQRPRHKMKARCSPLGLVRVRGLNSPLLYEEG